MRTLSQRVTFRQALLSVIIRAAIGLVSLVAGILIIVTIVFMVADQATISLRVSDVTGGYHYPVIRVGPVAKPEGGYERRLIYWPDYPDKKIVDHHIFQFNADIYGLNGRPLIFSLNVDLSHRLNFKTF